MWKHFSLNGSYKWINLISSLITNYNQKIHRTIKMKPCDVNASNEKMLLSTIYNNIKITDPRPKFKINDHVRISKYKSLFDKGYLPSWTAEIFQIRKIRNTNPVTYLLNDANGAEILGGFYEFELQKVKYPNIFLVEKILKRKKNKVFVRWLGYSKDFDSWVNKIDIVK